MAGKENTNKQQKPEKTWFVGTTGVVVERFSDKRLLASRLMKDLYSNKVIEIPLSLESVDFVIIGREYRLDFNS